MSVAVVIPFASDDPYRLRALGFVQTFYAEQIWPDGWTVRVAGDTAEGRPFSRARAINHGVSLGGEEIVLVNDADTIVAPWQLLRAVAYARGAPGLVYGYYRYRRLSRRATENLDCWQDAFHSEVEWQMLEAPSVSVMAIRRADFDALGGFDERFEGWGYEDIDFSTRAAGLAPLRRIDGDLFHLWHCERGSGDAPADADPRLVEQNLIRLRASGR